jgi:hypothetical protein
MTFAFSVIDDIPVDSETFVSCHDSETFVVTIIRNKIFDTLNRAPCCLPHPGNAAGGGGGCHERLCRGRACGGAPPRRPRPTRRWSSSLLA